MPLSNDINELNKQIQEIAKELKKTSFKLFKPGEVTEAQSALRGLREELKEFNSELSYIAGAFRDALNELSKQRVALTDSKRALRSISNIAIELTTLESERTLISDKQLDKLEKQAKSQFKLLTLAKQSGTLKKKELKEIENALNEQKTFEDGVKRIREVQNEIKKDSGVRLFGGLEGISKVIPGLSQFTNAFTEASKAAANVAFENQRNKEFLEEALKSGKGLTKERIRELGLSDKLKDKNNQILVGTAAAQRIRKLGLQNSIKQQSTLAAGFKVLGPIVAKAFSFGTILKSFLEFNKANREFRQVTGQSASNFSSMNGSIVSSIDQVKTITSLSKELGINVNAAFNKDTILAATELTELLGLSSTEAANLALRAEALGQNLSDVDDDTFSVVKNFNSTNRRAVNVQDVLKDTANASGMLATSLGKNPKALQEAAAAARGLGLSLKEVEGIADSLLNFQSSIEAELEAELLTGQQINLERARSAALMNDMETLSDEIGKNEAVINAFASGNRIQQQAIAKAMGISTDQMAKMYFQQKLNAGLTVEQAAKAADISVEEAKRLAVQEQITKSVEKLSAAFAPVLEIVASLVNNFVGMSIIIGGIVTMMGVSFLSSLAQALPLLTKMLVRMKAIKLQSLGSAIASAYNAAMKGPQSVMTGGIVGAIMGAALTAIIMSAVNRASKEDDFLLPAVGGSGYGKRMISAPEGTFALNDKDTIIAGTDLGKSESTSAPQNPPSTNINLAETNALLKQLISAVKASGNTVIEIDGNKLGKVIKQNEVSMG